MIAILVCVACVHNMDKVGFSMMLPSIKSAMSLTDTQLGFIAGPAFALLNAGAAIPLARIADRYRPTHVLALCIISWSGLTVLCGMATNFLALGLLRASVGLADAGARPISQALVAARYPPSRRSGMLAILASGSYAGTAIGLSSAGVLIELCGWRTALICLGLPGLLLGGVLWCTPVEQDKAQPPVNLARHGEPIGRADWLSIIRQADFIDATLAIASASILGWALVAWLPSFLQRSYGMRLVEIGFWLSSAMGIGAAAGALAGGGAANYLHARWPKAGLWLSFWTTLISAPLLTMAFVTDVKMISIACVIASGVTGAVCLGPVYAHVQGLANGRTRATVAAVLGVSNILLGQAAGPLLVGAISDVSARLYGAQSLRFSLEVVSLLGFWPAVHLYRLARR